MESDTSDSECAEQARITLDYLERAFDKRKTDILDVEAYMLTSYILTNNSDFHVMWNFRREILLHWRNHGIVGGEILKPREYFKGFDDYEFFKLMDSIQSIILEKEKEKSEKEEEEEKVKKVNFDEICKTELLFTSKCLIQHLKSYATWHHRKTIILWMKNPPLESELDSCSEFFSLDQRNFHCWNYRKFICELLYGPENGLNNQLVFIKTMIKKSPENFSAFHYQSVLLNQLKENGLLGGDASSLEYQHFWNEEFNSIKSSLLNISSIQGLWLYFWWLCLMRFDMQKSESSRANPLLHRIILDKENRILVYQFNHCLRHQPFDSVTFILRGDKLETLEISKWQSLGLLASDIWFHKIDENIDCDNLAEIMFKYSDETHLIPIPPLNQSNLSIATINDLPKKRIDLIRQTQSIDWVNDICENSKDSQVVMELNRYLNLTKVLLSAEPATCELAKVIDPLRCNYYNDLQSRHLLEKKILETPLEPQLNLHNLSLTCVHPISRLTHLRVLDLSKNQLTRINGSFNSLIVLQSLILDNNHISMIDQSFKMVSLKRLSLQCNRLSHKSSLKSCNNCEKLEQIIIFGNMIVLSDLKELQIDSRIELKF